MLGLALPAHAAPAAPNMVRRTCAADELSHYTDLGALAPAPQVQTVLVLTDPNAAGERRLLAAQAAGRANFVTAAEWDAAFGVPQATYDTAVTFATAHGLSVTSTTGSRD